MKIPIVLICDNNFALPTGVAIRSLYENRDQATDYHIYVLCDNVEEGNRQRLTRLSSPGFQIELMDVCEGEDFEALRKKYLHVSTTAMLKFYLPKLFPQYGKLLYLDGDILILRDLRPLYEQPISDVYLAAVSDRHAIYYPAGIHFRQRLGVDHKNYFNSGVMLLNLDKMREDGISERLMDYRENGVDAFMDQDALNVALGGKIRYLSILYNALATCIWRYDRACLNECYPQEPLDENWMDHIYIYHYASQKKPWKYADVEYGAYWDEYFQRSDFADLELTREYAYRDKEGERARLSQLIGENGEGVLISVIVPVYNTQRFLNPCLTSVLCQKTFEQLEVICIDDGSTDDSKYIIQDLMRFDPRLVLLEQKRQYAGAARNRGIQAARGKYIMFLDSDDKLVSGTALLHAYEKAEKLELDYLACMAQRLSEQDKPMGNCGWCLRKDMLPEEEVFSRRELGLYLYQFSGGACWAKLYRRQFLLEEHLFFPELPRSEDFCFTQLVVTKAKRMSALEENLTFYRRSVSYGSLESTKDETPLIFWEADQIFYQALREEGVWEEVKTSAQFASLHRLFYNAKAMNTVQGFLEVYNAAEAIRQWIGPVDSEGLPLLEAECAEVDRLLTMSPLDYIHTLWQRDHKSLLSTEEKRYLIESQKRELDGRYKRVRDEKIALDGKYKQLRDDKIALDGKYKQLRDDKIALDAKYKQLRDEKVALDAKYKQLRDEKVALDAKYKQLRDEKTELEGKYRQLRDEKTELEGKYRQLRNEKRELDERYKRVRDEKIALDGKYKQLRDDKIALDGKYKQLRDDKIALDAKYKQLRDEKIALDGKYKQLRDEKIALDAKYKQLRDEKRELEGRHKRLRSEKAEQDKRCECLNEEVGRLNEEIRRLNAEVSGLKRRQKELEGSRSYRLGRLLTAPLRQIRRLWEKIRKKKSEEIK